MTEVKFLAIEAYSKHPDIYEIANELVTELHKGRQRKDANLYNRDARKLLASILLHSQRHGTRLFRFSTKKDYFSGKHRKQVWLTPKVLRLFNLMLSLDWIRKVHSALPPSISKTGQGLATIYEPTDALLSRMAGCSIDAISRNPDMPCLVVKDNGKALSMPEAFYNETLYVTHAEVLKSTASRLVKAGVRRADGSVISEADLALRRIFTNAELNEGGRFYSAVGCLPKAERVGISIGTEPVTSMDIVQSHPTLMLRVFNGKPREDGLFNQHLEDVYEIPGFNNIPRAARKMAVNALFNASTITAAKKALANLYWHADDITGKVTAEVYSSNKKRSGQKVFSGNIDGFIDSFMLFHPDFARHIGSGIGNKLMAIEGALAWEMLKEADKRDLPIIPVHDEFIVPHSRKAELEQLFHEVCEQGFASTGIKEPVTTKWEEL